MFFRTTDKSRWLCILALTLAPSLHGQNSAAAQPTILIKHGTPVVVRLAQTICSANAHAKDPLKFVVVKDVVVDGFTAIKTGTEATGSVGRVTTKRPFAVGGSIVVNVDSVTLANHQSVRLVDLRKFTARSHAVKMGFEIAAASAIYWPAAPVFLLSHGRDRTVLKGTEFTAYTAADTVISTAGMPHARETDSNMSEAMNLVPPRALNAEGVEGDMLNLVFLARQQDLEQAFARAGWLTADRSSSTIIWNLLWQRKHYMKLPMRKLYVYGRPQDYSFVLPDPRLIVSRRHHIRIWKTDREVNGVPLWVAAATLDVSIEVVMSKLQFYHRIDPDVDAERDFIAQDLEGAWQLSRDQYMQSNSPVLSAKTANGQTYHSDGRLRLVDLNRKENQHTMEPEVAGTSR